MRLTEWLKHKLRAVRAYLLKEKFQFFWTYISPYWAGKFLDRWCIKTMRSKIDPMKKVARMSRQLLLNWFRAKGQLSSSVVEGFNGKAKLISKRAFGFRTFRAVEIALYHRLGALPEPKFTHEFCWQTKMFRYRRHKRSRSMTHQAPAPISPKARPEPPRFASRRWISEGAISAAIKASLTGTESASREVKV